MTPRDTAPETYAIDEPVSSTTGTPASERPAEQPNYEERTDEPVLVYFQEIRTVPLLDRKGEVEIAKRIEQAEKDRLLHALGTPFIAHKLLARLQDGELALEDVCELPDDMELSAAGGHLEEVRAALASCDPCEPAGAYTQATAVCEVAAPVATEEVLQRLQNLHFKTGLLQEGRGRCPRSTTRR